METLNYLGRGFGVAMTPTNLITALIGTPDRHYRRPAAGPPADQRRGAADPGGLRPGPAAGNRADPARRRVPGLRVRRADQLDPAQHPRRSLDRDDHPRRLPDGTQRASRRWPCRSSAWSSFIGAFIATCGMVGYGGGSPGKTVVALSHADRSSRAAGRPMNDRVPIAVDGRRISRRLQQVSRESRQQYNERR